MGNSVKFAEDIGPDVVPVEHHHLGVRQNIISVRLRSDATHHDFQEPVFKEPKEDNGAAHHDQQNQICELHLWEAQCKLCSCIEAQSGEQYNHTDVSEDERG